MGHQCAVCRAESTVPLPHNPESPSTAGKLFHPFFTGKGQSQDQQGAYRKGSDGEIIAKNPHLHLSPGDVSP